MLCELLGQVMQGRPKTELGKYYSAECPLSMTYLFTLIQLGIFVQKHEMALVEEEKKERKMKWKKKLKEMKKREKKE